MPAATLPAELAAVLDERGLDPSAHTIIVTRGGCHLCEQAEHLLARHCPPGTIISLDVDAHPGVCERFTDHVPVVWINGRLLGYWTLAEDQLTAALAGHDWPDPPPL